ncbi:MAG: polyprenyl synthetase family protein [bacterium]|nr:polyprenyl synthetase family protein [bacterium]
MSVADLFPDRFESSLQACLPSAETCQPELLATMSYSLLSGGKRLRPRLLAAAAGLGNCPTEPVLLAGAAVEMIHCYSLIHDDLPAMDNDDWRRGQPSCHKVHGETMAILAGDALQPLAFETLLAGLDDVDLPTERKLLALRELARTAGPQNLVGGQAADTTCSFPDSLDNDPLTRVEWIQLRKTSAMFRCPLVLGGILANLPDAELAALGECGLLLGNAFQAVDDLLDRRASLAELGKTPGKDESQGKLTIVSILGEEDTHRRVLDLQVRALSLLPERPESGAIRELADKLINRRF